VSSRATLVTIHSKKNRVNEPRDVRRRCVRGAVLPSRGLYMADLRCIANCCGFGKREAISPAWGHDSDPGSWHMSAWQWMNTYGERPAVETISALIFDNLFERFPQLKVLKERPSAIFERHVRLTPHPEDDVPASWTGPAATTACSYSGRTSRMRPGSPSRQTPKRASVRSPLTEAAHHAGQRMGFLRQPTVKPLAFPRYRPCRPAGRRVG
jgi:hypothetical protein